MTNNNSSCYNERGVMATSHTPLSVSLFYHFIKKTATATDADTMFCGFSIKDFKSIKHYD